MNEPVILSSPCPFLLSAIMCTLLTACSSKIISNKDSIFIYLLVAIYHVDLSYLGRGAHTCLVSRQLAGIDSLLLAHGSRDSSSSFQAAKSFTH